MDKLEFKISSALKNIIGRDLITDDFIAVFELVKNSYDGYAKHVDIIFEEDRIVIKDDGKGMSLDDIKKKWLFLAYSAKTIKGEEDKNLKSYRDKINSKRYYAGAKGIGRFSCDRLGQTLTLITRKIGFDDTEKLIVDWGKFEKDSTEEFVNIKVDHESIKNQFPHGTILEITGLHSKWDREKLRRLKHSLEKLINPFSRESKNKKKTDFSIEITCKVELQADKKEKNKRDKVNGFVGNFIFETLNLKTTHIETRVSKDWIDVELIDRGTLIYKIREANKKYTLIEDGNYHLFFLNRAAKNNFSRQMGVEAKNFGSVFLFKNGFRVYPLGDPEDDSLGMDYRKQQGYARFLGTRDLLGRIEIYSDNNDEFKEVTSRDGGLVETQGYKQLKDSFLEKCLKLLERYVVDVQWGIGLEKKGYESEKKLLETDKDKEDISIIKKNVGSRAQFAEIIKKLANNKSVEILYYNKDLISIIDDKLELVKPEFFEDLAEIAEKTKDKALKSDVLRFEKRYQKLLKEKDEAEKRAIAEEKKRQEAEQKALDAEIAKDKAEKATQKAKEAQKRAELIAKEKELKRREEEIKRKEAERELEKKKEQLSITTSIASQDLNNVTNLHHQVRVITDVIKTELVLFSRRLNRGEKISDKELKDFLNKVSFENSKIESISKFGTRAIFENFTDVSKADISAFIENYVKKISNYFSSSKMKIIFHSSIKKPFEIRFRPLDISIIIDNMISNSKKAESSLLNIDLIPVSDKAINLIFKDNGKGLSKEVIDLKEIFGQGYSTTKSTGLGLFHIKNLIDDHNWAISVNTKPQKGIEFILTLKK